jgi:hypothetical protein
MNQTYLERHLISDGRMSSCRKGEEKMRFKFDDAPVPNTQVPGRVVADETEPVSVIGELRDRIENLEKRQVITTETLKLVAKLMHSYEERFAEMAQHQEFHCENLGELTSAVLSLQNDHKEFAHGLADIWEFLAEDEDGGYDEDETETQSDPQDGPYVYVGTIGGSED